MKKTENKHKTKKSVKIPKTINQIKPRILKKTKVSDEEFLQVWEKISKKLGYKFKFGYHSYDDMKQQAAIFALEGLKNYDYKRPLENFLWTHVRNRLFNYKRDNYQRPDKPCLTCPFYRPNNPHKCAEFTSLYDCPLYASWSKRNDAKKSIVQPSSIDNLNNESHDTNVLSFLESVENKEIIKKIDENISIKNRPIFLKFIGGSKLPKNQINKLTEEIKEILKNNYE